MISQFYFVKTPAVVQVLYHSVLWSIPTDEKKIYLTFDDGPTPLITDWVLAILKQYNAKATFFCTGKNSVKFPTEFQKIVASGHSIGNHTYSHLNGWNTSKNNYINDVLKAQKTINSKLFRPPYGKISTPQINALKNDFSIVMWDVLSGDFDLSITPQICAKNVLKNAKKGSIIVFHDSIKAEKNLKYALPTILDYFSKLDYSFDKL